MMGVLWAIGYIFVGSIVVVCAGYLMSLMLTYNPPASSQRSPNSFRDSMMDTAAWGLTVMHALERELTDMLQERHRIKKMLPIAKEEGRDATWQINMGNRVEHLDRMIPTYEEKIASIRAQTDQFMVRLKEYDEEQISRQSHRNKLLEETRRLENKMSLFSEEPKS